MTPPRALRLEQQGGLSLAARLHQPTGQPRAAAVIAHGLFSSMQSQKLTRLAQALAGRGCASLQYDSLGCGDSPGEVRLTTLSGRLGEFLAAARTLRGLYPGLPLVFVGSSLGGSVALLAARELPPACLALWSAPVDMQALSARLAAKPEPPDLPYMAADLAAHDVAGAAAEARGALFLHGELDEVVPLAHAHLGHGLAGAPKALLVLAGADHRLSRPEDQLVATARTLDWITLLTR
jgi:fermentation-respiration switch protein FrsA (DUF1100 family)